MRRPASAGRGSPLTPPLQGQPRELPRSTAAALPHAQATTAGSAAVPVRAASASSRASGSRAARFLMRTSSPATQKQKRGKGRRETKTDSSTSNYSLKVQLFNMKLEVKMCADKPQLVKKNFVKRWSKTLE